MKFFERVKHVESVKIYNSSGTCVISPGESQGSIPQARQYYTVMVLFNYMCLHFFHIFLYLSFLVEQIYSPIVYSTQARFRIII